jgi:hypothetical protein
MRISRSSVGKTMEALLRLDALGRKFVSMCASLFPFRKYSGLLYLCNEKIHSVVHGASEIMRWGNLINTSGGGPEGTHKTNVKGPGSNVNHRDAIGATMMGHARGKECAALLGSAIQGCRVHFMFKH